MVAEYNEVFLDDQTMTMKVVIGVSQTVSASLGG
jgi:hypothetical protein